jgi:predicted nucleic acid-binding protein
MTQRGLLDTSVFVATEAGRPIRAHLVPDEVYVSVVTIAELRAGVHAARDTDTRALRLKTVESLAELEPLVVDSDAAGHWARLRFRLHETGRRANVNDLWIASVALANDLPIVTQDGDYEALLELGGPTVIRV